MLNFTANGPLPWEASIAANSSRSLAPAICVGDAYHKSWFQKTFWSRKRDAVLISHLFE